MRASFLIGRGTPRVSRVLDPYRRRHPGFRGHKGHTRLEIWMHHVSPHDARDDCSARIRSQLDCGSPRVAIACRCEARSFQWHDTLSYYDTQTEASIGYTKASAYSRLVRLSPRDERLHKLAALPLLSAEYAVLKLPNPRTATYNCRDATAWRWTGRVGIVSGEKQYS